MPESANDYSTRRRLIEAAGRLFAEKGFKETTVRSICEQAGANLAAVNYHFRDKEGLYEEVILSILNNIREEFPVDKDIDGAMSPESRLRTVVRNMLYRFNDPKRPAWQGTLLAWERMNPRPTILSIIQEEIKKTLTLLSSIVTELLGPGAKADDVRLCVESVIGQLMFQAHLRAPHAPPMVRKGTPSVEELNQLVHHITDFSLAGIEDIRRRGNGPRNLSKEPRETGQNPGNVNPL